MLVGIIYIASVLCVGTGPDSIAMWPLLGWNKRKSTKGQQAASGILYGTRITKIWRSSCCLMTKLASSKSVTRTRLYAAFFICNVIYARQSGAGPQYKKMNYFETSMTVEWEALTAMRSVYTGENERLEQVLGTLFIGKRLRLERVCPKARRKLYT